MVRKARMVAAAAAVVVVLGAVGCGGAASSAKVGPAGGVVQLQSGLTLQVPPGALQTEVEIGIREVEARHGRREFEIEPAETRLAIPARVKVEGAEPNDQIVEVEAEVEKQLEHESEQDGMAFAEVRHFGTLALNKKGDEASAGALACVPGCAAGLECDDGACKATDGSTDTGYWGANSGGVNAGKDDGTASDRKTGGESGKKGGGYGG
ncbi:MAG TPA: hypothetical protein VGK67_19765 [Myxococcales bacterium]|jgi:hypothetical protein